MEDPTDGVVEEFGLGVSLVTTFVGDDPKTGGNETSPEGIHRPERELGSAIEDRVWELNNLRVDTGIEKSGSLVDNSQGSKIRDAEGIYASNYACQRKEKGERRRTRRAKIATHFA